MRLNLIAPQLGSRRLPERIFLVRHAESTLNEAKRISGQLNPGLSANGSKQAEILASVLRSTDLDAIHSSGLQRTIKTALPTAEEKGLPVQRHDALNEIHHGVLQGRFRDDRDPIARDLWLQRKADKFNFRAPMGESLIDVENRVGTWLEQTLADTDGKRILIVGHRNTNRVILGILMAWRRERWVQLNLRSQYLYEVTLGQQRQIYSICMKGENHAIRKKGVKE